MPEENISSNTPEVAAPATESTTESSGASSNSQHENVNESSADSEQAETPEVAEPDQKPRQDSETNKAFQEMRHKVEQAEKQSKRDNSIARKYGAEWGLYSEADIAEKYGESHDIHTLEQFERAVQMEEYREKGIDPDEINKLVDNHPDIVQARQQRFDQMLLSNYKELQDEYPSLVKDPKDISNDVWVKWNNGNNGLSLAEAYTLVNRKKINEQQQAATKQAALNNLNSKNHMKPNGSDGSSLDLTQIPDDVLATYRKMFKGRSDQYFIDHYKRSNK